jgi:hypothetical protein
MSNDPAAEVAAAEQARCAAWSGEDVAPLDDLLADGIWYIHAHGVRDDKDALLAMLRAGRRTAARDSLDVQVYGDIAVATGGLVVTVPAVGDASVGDASDGAAAQRFASHVLQVWRRRDARWELIAQQSTPRAGE